MGRWTQLHNVTFADVADLIRGQYQAGIITGEENLSGSSLKGSARRWRGKYMQSRLSLLQRISQAGYRVWETTGTHNKRILHIGR